MGIRDVDRGSRRETSNPMSVLGGATYALSAMPIEQPQGIPHRDDDS